MDELARLPAVLHASFQRYAASAGDDDGTNVLHLESAVDQWVICLRGAFYSPQTTAKRDESISKFQQLERALVDALEAIPGRDGALFPGFIVQFVVALSREPVADPDAQDSPPTTQSDQPIVSPASPASTGASSEQTRKRPPKAVRVRTQPNAPIAFIVVGALKKLVIAPRNERFRDACHRQSRENAVLRAFCERELDAATRTVDTKLLVEVLELFNCDFVEDAAIRALVSNLLDTKQHSSLVRLLETFQSRLDWDFADIMRTMIQSKDWGSAELVAKTFETDVERQVLAKTLVEEAINLHDFKRAHRIVYNFGIQHEFPDIELLYSRDALLKLIEKQKWTLALSYVGSDATLQTVLLTHLVAAHEWRLATSLARDRMGMADFDPEKQALTTEELVKNGHSSSLSSLPVHGYLELTLKDEDVVFCDTEESVRLAASHFFSERSTTQMLVGLDVEWRPTSTKIASHTGSLTTTAVASILQIASATKAFIIDLLALHESEFLFDRFLLKLFSSESILKLGFGFDSDLKVLHQTFPERAAFRNVSPFVELSSIVQRVLGATVGNSLSNATALILGKPLDKRMQLSNWDERPLSHSQVVYAALDASCLVQICDHIQQYGLIDDKSDVTNWETVVSEVTGMVGLSSPLDDAESIASAVEYRKNYQIAWEQKLHHHGVIDSKDLISTTQVQAFWESCADLESITHQPDTALTVLPVQELEPLLAVVEEQPTAYVAVNSICFFADERPCVACIDSSSKLDTSRLATLCGLSRRKIKLATAMECETIWGFSPGTVPPFGHRISSEHPEIPIFVDIMLKEYEKWVSGSGSHDQLLVFSSTAFFRFITVKATSDIALQRNGTNRQLKHGDAQNAGDGFQDIPISSGEAPLEYKFLADTMVGRVGRWLRTIGIDVLIWGKKEELPLGVDELGLFPDRQSALIAIAAREQRIILTRDKKMADRRDAGACFVVSSDDPHQQFQEIKTHFALELRREDMMTRCAVCNFKGFEMIDRAYVKQHMPDAVNPNVLELVDEYWKCLACHKLYWVGPKYSSAYENMLAKFEGSTDL